ncbi:TraB/GumN family protein [Lysobacter solisilvae (ex Woo and Kim 2020)]|uniref:TraB/GumN family protein n=1 Tax=Agrilutibacter terrestris TaxID=2865112 RepID=A0A7H0FWD2_9GAMM|nr:TraB/GumN family protein [Lysobacter terrestris]QNP40348.1 TraB/GumN family protein [Lysobacter terrestris]
MKATSMKSVLFGRHGKTLAASLLGCALLAPAVHAWTKTEATPAPAVAAKAPPTPLLWKVSDRDNAIYLLGSFHLLKADDYPLSTDVDRAFERAGKVVFEVPPAELTDPALALKMQQLAGYADGRTLSQVLPPDVREKMAQVLGAERLAQLDPIEPWFISLGLVIGVSQQLGFSPEYGLDMHLARRAAAANKPVSGLETADEQLRVLDASPMDEQVQGLRDYFTKPGEVPRQLNDTHVAWRNGDVKRLSALAVDDVRKETPRTYRILNVERNNAWVPQLRQMLDGSRKGDVLVVVGAMHLLGADGVVEQLRAKGYKVERICSACRAPK